PGTEEPRPPPVSDRLPGWPDTDPCTAARNPPPGHPPLTADGLTADSASRAPARCRRAAVPPPPSTAGTLARRALRAHSSPRCPAGTPAQRHHSGRTLPAQAPPRTVRPL